MNKNNINIFAVLTIVFLICGCMPMVYTSNPGIKGSVIDIETKEPIEGVIVTLSINWSDPHKVQLSTESDKTGDFKIEREKYLGIYFFPMDILYVDGVINFEIIGYESKNVMIKTSAVDYDSIDIGVVELDREN